jgi:hypothetical protein
VFGHYLDLPEHPFEHLYGIVPYIYIMENENADIKTGDLLTVDKNSSIECNRKSTLASHKGQRRGSPFRQIDISRAIKGAQAAGILVGQVEVDAAGKIVIFNAAQAEASQPPDLYAHWKVGRSAHAA